MSQYTWATCSKVIRSEVNTLQMELQRLQSNSLIGMYIHGSLALGGFNPTRSDINLIVVMRQRMDVETKRIVAPLLMRLSKMPCPFDIHFLVSSDIFPFRHPLPYDLYYNETKRERMQQDLRNSTWRQWNDYVEYDPSLTIALYQPLICLEPLATELPAVPEQEFHKALIENVQAAQRYPLHDPISFVLNACRDAAYLRDSSILSKDAGGVWGLTFLPEQYHPLMQQVLSLYRGESPGRPIGRSAFEIDPL